MRDGTPRSADGCRFVTLRRMRLRHRSAFVLRGGFGAPHNRPVSNAARAYAMQISVPVGCRWLVAVGLAFGGCDRIAPSQPPPADVPESVAAQVAAVRVGRSSRIIASVPLADADWESLRGLDGLKELVLERGRVDDARAEILATLPDIERLVLRESPLTDVGFARLADCRSLRDLNVPQADCTAAGLRQLTRLEKLKSLRLGGPRLEGPEVAAAVAACPHLRSLHLIDVPIGDDGLAALRRLPGLWNLYLDGAGVSDEAWAVYFRACPGVHVHVDQAHHDRDPRRHE
jgi:hypothetical protein